MESFTVNARSRHGPKNKQSGCGRLCWEENGRGVCVCVCGIPLTDWKWKLLVGWFPASFTHTHTPRPVHCCLWSFLTHCLILVSHFIQSFEISYFFNSEHWEVSCWDQPVVAHPRTLSQARLFLMRRSYSRLLDFLCVQGNIFVLQVQRVHQSLPVKIPVGRSVCFHT